MYKIQSEITIEKPVREVYSFITRMENLPFWTDVKNVEKKSGTGEVGTIYEITKKGALKDKKFTVQILKKQAFLIFAYKDNSYSLENEIGYKFNEAGDKTVVTGYRNINAGFLASIATLSFLTKRDAKMDLEKSLLELKEFIEK